MATCDFQHRSTGVHPYYLAVWPQIDSERKGCFSEPAAHVDESFTGTKLKVGALPGTELGCCIPPTGRLHCGDENGDVLVVVDTSVAKGVGVCQRSNSFKNRGRTVGTGLVVLTSNCLE